MVRATFSEFSYGFAVTHSLVNSLPSIEAAPELPSLRGCVKRCIKPV